MRPFVMQVFVAAVAFCGSAWAFGHPERTASVMQAAGELSPSMLGGNGHLRSRLGHNKRRTLKALFPYYHTSDELHQEATQLVKKCNNKASIRTVQEGGVAIDVINVKAQQAVPVTNKIFLLFGEHSRELISPESGLHFLKILCGNTPVPSGAPDLADIFRHAEFALVLNGNPRSRRKVEQGDWCLRANPNGVDLNRNWDIAWSGSGSSSQQTYAGSKPFSEPETQIMKNLLMEFMPTTFLCVHSGTLGMYMPWAYDSKHLAHRNQQEMMNLLKDIDSVHCHCPYGAAGKEVGYDCPGTSVDWAFSNTNTSFAFAWEIYVGDGEAELRRRWQEKLQGRGHALLEAGAPLAHEHFHDVFQQHPSDFLHDKALLETESAHTDWCLSHFNPISQEKYETEVENWSVAYLKMAARTTSLSMSSPQLPNNP
mmetsp:Transcript_21250/g.41589  ORF Transcript_21250/g.41589 Transcript_21250/m.41589 type:complete len:426 (+) Transcript_21250:73-1350(+)